MMYTRPERLESLSQGDIVDECPIFGLDCDDGSIDLDAEAVRWRVRVVVLTQACDLAHEKATRVVVAVVHSAEDLVNQNLLKASLIRDRVRRHQVFGWYFLPEHKESQLSESIVDLRNLHTVPRAALQQLIADGKRLCRIETPYREHMAQHFSTTYARIALPEPYETKP